MNIPSDFFFQILLFLAGAFIGVLAAIFEDRGRKNLAWLLAFALIGASAIWWFAEQNSLVACPYNGATDEQTFTNLIRGEENGVLNNDIGAIKEVFIEGATITDTAAGRTLPAMQHYQELLSAIKFIKLNHYDIEVVKINTENAWVIASDTSTLLWLDTGIQEEFVSEPGAAHYIFAHDRSGCWKISHFSKQAENEPFP